MGHPIGQPAPCGEVYSYPMMVVLKFQSGHGGARGGRQMPGRATEARADFQNRTPLVEAGGPCGFIHCLGPPPP